MKRDEFFRVLFRPVTHALEAFAVKERPPGALPEEEFLKQCTGCDECMKACPVNVIMIEDQELRHPVIYPEKDPCIHCEDTPCIQSCPTGALTLKIQDKQDRKAAGFTG